MIDKLVSIVVPIEFVKAHLVFRNAAVRHSREEQMVCGL
jgi:hypothetical protein